MCRHANMKTFLQKYFSYSNNRATKIYIIRINYCLVYVKYITNLDNIKIVSTQCRLIIDTIITTFDNATIRFDYIFVIKLKNKSKNMLYLYRRTKNII